MHPDIQNKFDSYPPQAKKQLLGVRELILAIAADNNLGCVAETLKWGEASYAVKGGSAIRIDWKAKDPNAIKVYFHCQSKLVETFQEIYPDDLQYEGKRAIVIPLHSKIEEGPLSHCIGLALKYHRVKHLPLLGA